MHVNENINENDRRLTKEQERMRRSLRYHFMNPKEKWQAKGTLPIKLVLIIVKLIILTTQLILFSDNNANEVSFIEGSKTSFNHLFLSTWDASYETLPYPPSTGPFAIYKVHDFYTFSAHALETYYKLKDHALGAYGYTDDDNPQMNLTVFFYPIKSISPSNSTYSFSNKIRKRTIELKPFLPPNGSEWSYNVKEYLEKMNFSIDFDGLVEAKIQFSLRTILLTSFQKDQIPDCFQFDISINFDNTKHNGQVLVDLHSDMTELTCKNLDPNNSVGYTINNFILSIDILSLCFSILSFVLCCRSVVKLYRFWREAKDFFLTEMGVDITDKRSHFIKVSYMVLFFGDLFIISGTIIKLQLYSMVSKKGVANFSSCTYFLGIGVFLAYLALIRYFSYYPKSSILINTIRAATPPLLRFSLCSTILYLAFSLLGWIILGPYHLKFRTLISSISCLFSLMNGDDMYVTLSITDKADPVIFVFSQFFVYLFCLLFIFVVLNLILTIIIEAYNQVQKQDSSVFCIDVFWNFINSCPESSKSPLYRSDLIYDKSLRKQRLYNFSRKCVDSFCCCIGKGSHTVEIKNACEHSDPEHRILDDGIVVHEENENDFRAMNDNEYEDLSDQPLICDQTCQSKHYYGSVSRQKSTESSETSTKDYHYSA